MLCHSFFQSWLLFFMINKKCGGGGVGGGTISGRFSFILVVLFCFYAYKPQWVTYIHSNELKIFCEFWKSVTQILTRFLFGNHKTLRVSFFSLAMQIHIKESTHGWLNIAEPSEPHEWVDWAVHLRGAKWCEEKQEYYISVWERSRRLMMTDWSVQAWMACMFLSQLHKPMNVENCLLNSYTWTGWVGEINSESSRLQVKLPIILEGFVKYTPIQ